MHRQPARLAVGIAFWLLLAAFACATGVSQSVSLTADRLIAPRHTVVHLIASVSPMHAGTIEFLDGTHSVLTVPLSPHGIAVLSIASLSRGRHSLTAIYRPADTSALSSDTVEVEVLGLEAPLRLASEPAIAGKPFRIALSGMPADASGTYTLAESEALATVTPASQRTVIDRDILLDGPTQSDAPIYRYLRKAASSAERQAALAWLATPREYKQLLPDPSVLATGPTLTFHITSSGGPLYLWQRSGSGAYTTSLDGAPPISRPATGFLRLPVEPGPHTLTIDIQSGGLQFLGLGTPPSPGVASVHPTVLGAEVDAADAALFTADGLDVRAEEISSETTGPAPPQALTLEATLNQPGPHTVRILYSGDASYLPSTHTLDLVVLPRAQTRVTFATPATIYPANAPVPLTASVSPATATGSILFVEAGASLASASLQAGAASASIRLAPGIHSLSASYSGDTDDEPAASPPVQIQMVPGPATLTLSPLPPEIVTGTPLTLTASILPAAATGNFTFLDAFPPLGPAAIGSARLVDGSAQLEAGSLLPGTHVLSATYAGDDRNQPAASPPLTVTVDAIPTATVLAPVPGATYGPGTTLTATVTPPTATGTVTFRDSTGVLLGQSTLAGPAASLTTAPLPPGSHTFTATYSGDPTHAPSTSAGITAIVHAAASTTLLAASATTVDAAQPITFTATLSPANATGTILFQDPSGNVLGRATLTGGTASITLSALPIGRTTVAAAYGGDLYVTPSTSAPVTVQVDALPTITTLAPIPAAAYGASLTLTATVTPPTATGSVTFADNGKPLGTAPILNGTATLPAGIAGVASHTIVATYPGDSTHTGSTSSAATAVISPDATTTTATLAQTHVPAGGFIAVNVQVACTCPAVPAGAVQFATATATLSNGTPGIAYATLTIPATALGIFAGTATYTGTAEFTASTSNPLTYTVVPTPTLGTLSLSAAQVAITAPVTLTAVIQSGVTQANGQIPTGSVTFRSGSTVLATVPLDPAGRATTTLAPALGVYAITAVYSPTGLFASTQIPGQTLTVTVPLALALDPTPVLLQAGHSVVTQLTVTPLSGFQGPATAQCLSPALYLVCTVDPPNTLSVPVTLAVHLTAARTTSGQLFRAALLLILPLALFRRRRALLPILLIALSGCASGGSFQNLPPGPQVLHLQVTAAGITADAALTVNLSD